MKSKTVLEVCVDSLESALSAQKGGAERVELCDNLMEGGTTPSLAKIEIARRELKIGLQVMIRPRGGDFYCSDLEFEIMQRDIEVCKSVGVDGVVFGILERDGDIDFSRTEKLIDRARPLSVTFHRAFDVSKDAGKSLETLIKLGVDRVLTSGQEATAFEGLEMIAELVKSAGERIVVMAGGGLNERNVRKFIDQTGVKEVHLTGLTRIESQMRYRHERVFMGGALRPPEFARAVTSEKLIGIISRQLR